MTIKLKKITSLVLTITLLFSVLAVGSAAAANTADYSTVQQVVMALNIMTGDDTGNLKLNQSLTRAEFAKILIQMSPKRNSVSGTSGTSPFSDVPAAHWASAYIREAVKSGYLKGMPDGTYRPDTNVKVEEVATAFLALLGYSSADFGSGYPSAQMSYAEYLNLFSGVSVSTGAYITRGDLIQVIYNTLNAASKSGSVYITALGYPALSGKVDAETIISDSFSDPITVKSQSWYSSLGLKTAYVTVYRNDTLSALSNIQTNDIVYYSKNLNTVRAYSAKTTGVLQSVSPSRTAPTSVTVSGMTYSLEGTNASDALKGSSGIQNGETVTLLLGENGVCDIITYGDGTATVYGYATASGTNIDNTNYISVVMADGRLLYYQVVSGASGYVGSVVKLTIGNGSVTVAKASGYTLSGTISAASHTFGGKSVAPDVSVLEVDSKGGYSTAFFSQMNGLSLTASNVLYYATDANGMISELIITGISTGSFGPLTVTSGTWYSNTGINAATATVYRNGELASLGSIQTYDIVYYSVSENTVWAYSSKVTGILQSVSPNRTNPVSVTISGTSYTLESSAATDAFSSAGGIKIGDTVTLLLGESGEVADVITISDSVSVTGYVTGSGKTTAKDSGGSSYSTYYVDIVLADGRALQYFVNSDASSYVDSVAKITFSNGSATVSRAGGGSVSGKVSSSSMTLGGSRLADGVNILEVDNDGNYAATYIQRLDGITLSSSQIRYAGTNAAGEINELILANVTGDAYIYGVLTSVSEASEGMSIVCKYEYNIGGVTGELTVTGKTIGAVKGPAALIGTANKITDLKGNLTALGSKVYYNGMGYVTTSAGIAYECSDSLVVYEYNKSTASYTSVSLSEAASYNGTFTAYYDKLPSDGGRIRVLIVG